MTIKKSITILVVVALMLALTIFVVVSNKKTVTYKTVSIVKGDIIQTVSETGVVKSNKNLSLGFLNNGQIEKINVRIGSKVKQGQILAELDYSSLQINKQEAQANLDVARENLNKLISGTTDEEVAIARANLSQAKSSYQSAENELEKITESVNESIAQARKKLNDLESSTSHDVTATEQAIKVAENNLANTKTTYQNTIDNYIDVAMITIEDKLAVANTALDIFDRTINDSDGKDLISVKDMSYLSTVISLYDSAIIMLNEANNNLDIAKINQSNGNVGKAVKSTASTLNSVFSALKACFSALENSVTSSRFTQANLDALKSGISAQQTLASLAISAVQTAGQNLDNAIISYDVNVSNTEEALVQARVTHNDSINTAENNLSSAIVNGDKQIVTAQSKVNLSLESWKVYQAQLTKILAPANKHDVSLANARIRQASASLSSVENQIENSVIKSPINGTVTDILYEIGEKVGSGQGIITMLGNSAFQIEVLISEADIAKVSINDIARITLDAFGEDKKFQSKITFIEPAETIIQAVIYYKLDISFVENGDGTTVYSQYYQRIKSGMTANVDITTEEKMNVLLIPNRAIIDRNGDGKFIRILIGGEAVERKVSIGLRGDDGLVELLSGAKEGEKIIISTSEK